MEGVDALRPDRRGLSTAVLVLLVGVSWAGEIGSSSDFRPGHAGSLFHARRNTRGEKGIEWDRLYLIRVALHNSAFIGPK